MRCKGQSECREERKEGGGKRGTQGSESRDKKGCLMEEIGSTKKRCQESVEETMDTMGRKEGECDLFSLL